MYNIANYIQVLIVYSAISVILVIVETILCEVSYHTPPPLAMPEDVHHIRWPVGPFFDTMPQMQKTLQLRGPLAPPLSIYAAQAIVNAGSLRSKARLMSVDSQSTVIDSGRMLDIVK